MVYFLNHPSKIQRRIKIAENSLFLRFSCNFAPAHGPICMKISATILNLMLNIMYIMLHHIKMQGKPTNCGILHFCALRAQLRSLRARDPKSDNASLSASLLYPLSPNFVQIEATLLPKTPMQPERRLSPYVATVAGSANSLSVGPSGPNKKHNLYRFKL